MKKKILGLVLTGVMAIGLIGCGGIKETDKKYPFFKDMQIIKVDKDTEGLSLKLNEEDVKTKINELLNEFETAAKEGTTKKFGLVDMPIVNNEGIESYSINWENYQEIADFKLGDSQGMLGITIKNDEKVEGRKTINYTIGLANQYVGKEYTFDTRDATKAQIEWLNTQGFNIDIEELEKNIKDKLVRSNKGEIVEKEIINLDEDGTKMEIQLIPNGGKKSMTLTQQLYTVGIVINGYDVYLNDK